MDNGEGELRRYWRIGTGDKKLSYWDLMLSQSKVCIGWSATGDLGKANVKSKRDLELLLKNSKDRPTTNSTLSGKALEIFNFYYNIKPGDVILAQRGETILGIGIASGGYYYNEKDTFAHQRKVDWKIIEPDLKNNDQNIRTTVREIIQNELINLVNELLGFENKLITKNNSLKFMQFPLNQILYGPPGTGKTYHTIAKAVSIIDGLTTEELESKSREYLKNRFEKLKGEGRIVFCTFHQSMSYEDFIEGIKPMLNEEEAEGNLSYRIEDGLFKKLSIEAQYQFYKTASSNQQHGLSRAELFNIAYNEFISNVEEKIDNDQVVQLVSITGLKLYITQVSNLLNLKIKHDGDVRERPYIVSRPRLLKLFTHFEKIDDIKNLHKDIRGVIGGSNTTAYWAVLSELFKTAEKVKNIIPSDVEPTESDLAYQTIKMLNADLSLKRQGDPSQKFVLIIDEINRGNVSQIFGELISLIEDDKRLGAKEALEATLPYSKEKFGVPQNLYIVGTMNTADRSVEALDTALRRRFSFTEMSPDATQLIDYTVGEFFMADILNAINNRIEKLLDRDHQIGHSYLMVNDLDSLKAVFRSKIIPLLQEYFFGDYGKIGLILGKGFIEKTENKTTFADFDYDELSAYDERTFYKMTDISAMNESAFTAAVQILLNK